MKLTGTGVNFKQFAVGLNFASFREAASCSVYGRCLPGVHIDNLVGLSSAPQGVVAKAPDYEPTTSVGCYIPATHS
jgi:hypothetical protein